MKIICHEITDQFLLSVQEVKHFIPLGDTVETNLLSFILYMPDIYNIITLKIAIDIFHQPPLMRINVNGGEKT